MQAELDNRRGRPKRRRGKPDHLPFLFQCKREWIVAHGAHLWIQLLPCVVRSMPSGLGCMQLSVCRLLVDH